MQLELIKQAVESRPAVAPTTDTQLFGPAMAYVLDRIRSGDAGETEYHVVREVLFEHSKRTAAMAGRVCALTGQGAFTNV